MDGSSSTEEPSGSTDSRIPASGTRGVGGCCSHCSLLFGFSSQCTEFLWPEAPISFMYEYINWVRMKGIHKLTEVTVAKHGEYGPWVGTALNPLTTGILQQWTKQRSFFFNYFSLSSNSASLIPRAPRTRQHTVSKQFKKLTKQTLHIFITHESKNLFLRRAPNRSYPPSWQEGACNDRCGLNCQDLW